MALEKHSFWRWTIILRKRVAPYLVKSQFCTSFISRETVCLTKSQFLHQSLNVCVWRWKISVFPQLFPFGFTPRSHLNFQNRNFSPVLDGWPSCRAPGLTKFALCQMFGRPTCAQKKFTLHQGLGVRHTRSLQTVATGKEDSHFTTPHVSPSDTRHLRRGLRKDKQDPHFATRLGVRYAAEGNISYATAWLSLPQREIEELEKSDFAGLQIQFDHLEVSWAPV